MNIITFGLRGVVFLISTLWMLLAPSSSFSQVQEENVCITCHQDLDEELAQPVALWKTSIHSKNGISCESCHGGDARNEEMSMEPEAGFIGSPEEEEIPELCGQCHVAVKDNYQQSPHGAALGEGAPTCVTCHTTHEQKRATLDLISEDLCGSCHDFEQGRQIKLLMAFTESTLEGLDERIHRLQREAMNVTATEKALFAVRNSFHRLTHVLSADKFVRETSTIEKDLKRIEQTIREGEDTLRQRNRWGVFLIVFFLISAYVVHRYRKTLPS